jgi:antitoxin HicB
MKLIKPSLEYYLNLKYSVTLYPDVEQGGYVAEIKDLPGCFTQGETLAETMTNINEAGDNIPLPSTYDNYSGKLMLRMPKSLHRRLSETAEREGVSLNQYIVYLVSIAR